jgi:hypothetical protein
MRFIGLGTRHVLFLNKWAPEQNEFRRRWSTVIQFSVQVGRSFKVK